MSASFPLDYSPFSPGKPVPVEQFVGRNEEVRRLIQHVQASSKGQLQVAFLAGDRGIGKSSLAAYIKSYAERACNLVGVHVLLGGVTALDDMTRRVFERVLHESNDKKWYEPIKSLFGRSVESADLFGMQLKFVPDDKQLDFLVRNFGEAIRNLIKKLRDEAKKGLGLVLILDDINGLAASQAFADWLKSLIDGLSMEREPVALCLIVVGIDERRQSLVELNPSLARAFDLFELEPWSEDETRQFFKESFLRHGVECEAEALTLMARYSGGRPELAHQIGDSVFREDDNRHVSMKDASNGIVAAVEMIGRKYLKTQVFDEIRRSKIYRAMLLKVAKSIKLGTLTFERNTLKEVFSTNEFANVDNFLRRMKDIGVIVGDENEAGVYRFASYIHHTYLYMQGYMQPDSIESTG
jgi:hypothetical protein